MTEISFKVEIGENIVKMATPSDKRGLIGKIFGEISPKLGDYLLTGTQQLRKMIQEEEGWVIPVIKYTDNNRIRGNDVIIRTPISTNQFSITSLNQLFEYLLNISRWYYERIRKKRIFIGHGRSLVWLELKEILTSSLDVEVIEYNQIAVAGMQIQDRLFHMLNNADIAFIVMTAEDELKEGRLQARPNVIHELGLFQGKLGFNKTIILIEKSCSDFSNIHGLNYIQFDNNSIGSAYLKIKKVLERESII